MQTFGLTLLERQDEIEREQARFERVRLALLAATPNARSVWFPEYFPPPAEQAAEADLSGTDALNLPDTEYDYSGVEWQSPAEMSPEELEEMQSFFTEGVGVTMNEDGEWV